MCLSLFLSGPDQYLYREWQAPVEYQQSTGDESMAFDDPEELIETLEQQVTNDICVRGCCRFLLFRNTHGNYFLQIQDVEEAIAAHRRRGEQEDVESVSK